MLPALPSLRARSRFPRNALEVKLRGKEEEEERRKRGGGREGEGREGGGGGG